MYPLKEGRDRLLVIHLLDAAISEFVPCSWCTCLKQSLYVIDCRHTSFICIILSCAMHTICIYAYMHWVACVHDTLSSENHQLRNISPKKPNWLPTIFHWGGGCGNSDGSKYLVLVLCYNSSLFVTCFFVICSMIKLLFVCFSAQLYQVVYRIISFCD